DPVFVDDLVGCGVDHMHPVGGRVRHIDARQRAGGGGAEIVRAGVGIDVDRSGRRRRRVIGEDGGEGREKGNARSEDESVHLFVVCFAMKFWMSATVPSTMRSTPSCPSAAVERVGSPP